MASLSAASNLAMANLVTSNARERTSVAVRLLSLCLAGPSRSTVLPFQRKDRSAGAIPTTILSAARNLATANLITSNAKERTSAAVRSLCIPSRSRSLNFYSFLAKGKKCWRDSYNKPQCGDQPCDGKSGYEQCPGENFCCRMAVVPILKRSESLTLFTAKGQKCWRDSYNKPQCGEKPCDGKPDYEQCQGEDFCCRASTLLCFSWSESLNGSSFLAKGQKCWRDSYNNPQCGEKPCDGKPDYEQCPGEDFCCRTTSINTEPVLVTQSLFFSSEGTEVLA